MAPTAAGEARKSMKLWAVAGCVDATPTPAEKMVTLDLRGQRPDEVDTFHWKQLADLLKTDLSVAAGHNGADSLATLDSAALRQHPVGYP